MATMLSVTDKNGNEIIRLSEELPDGRVKVTDYDGISPVGSPMGKGKTYIEGEAYILPPKKPK